MYGKKLFLKGFFSIIVMIGLLMYSLIDGDPNRSPFYYLVISLIVILWVCILLFIGYVPKRKIWLPK